MTIQIINHKLQKFLSFKLGREISFCYLSSIIEKLQTINSSRLLLLIVGVVRTITLNNYTFLTIVNIV